MTAKPKLAPTEEWRDGIIDRLYQACGVGDSQTVREALVEVAEVAEARGRRLERATVLRLVDSTKRREEPGGRQYWHSRYASIKAAIKARAKSRKGKRA